MFKWKIGIGCEYMKELKLIVISKDNPYSKIKDFIDDIIDKPIYIVEGGGLKVIGIMVSDRLFRIIHVIGDDYDILSRDDISSKRPFLYDDKVYLISDEEKDMLMI